MSTYYLAGKMRGVPQFNFPMFDRAARALRAQGHKVISPAEHDRENGFNEITDTLDDFDLKAAMSWDLDQIVNHADAVVLLPGWWDSKGATAERATAVALGKPCYQCHLYGESCYLVSLSDTGEDAEDAPQSSDEVRVTNEKTGGQKGRKAAQLGAVDPQSLLEVATVAGFGGDKYERYNFTKGFDWSLSFDAMLRHALAFWSGVDNDEESGLPHMAHAAWHCLTLLTFMRHHKDFDDRFPL